MRKICVRNKGRDVTPYLRKAGAEEENLKFLLFLKYVQTCLCLPLLAVKHNITHCIGLFSGGCKFVCLLL